MSPLPSSPVPLNLQSTVATYDGTTGEACFVLGGRLVGPLAMSVSDYHVTLELVRLAKRDGAKQATDYLTNKVADDMKDASSRIMRYF